MESDVFRPVTRLNFTSLAFWNRQFVHGDITAEAEACSVSQRTQVDCDRVLRSCCRGPLFSLSSAVFSLRLCVKPSGELPQNSTLWCQQTDVNILLKQQQTVSKTVLWRSSIFRTFHAEWNVCISTYIWTTAFIRFWRQAFLQNNTYSVNICGFCWRASAHNCILFANVIVTVVVFCVPVNPFNFF